MSIDFFCHATVKITENGEPFISIPPEQKLEYRAKLKQFKKLYQGHVAVKITKIKRKRSTGYKSQNHKINGDCQLIAFETGNSHGVVKEICKSRAVDMGYPMLLKDDGTPHINMMGMTSGISEADASVEDAIILIEAIQALAAEYGIILKGDNYA